MKLEVGMYVRTKRDIGKVTDVYERLDGNMVFNIGIYQHYFTEIKKASHNILELIEPMDLMFIDISPDDCGGIVVPRIAETINELEQWKERISNKNCILKYVVTKEQIESARYKVGD